MLRSIAILFPALALSGCMEATGEGTSGALSLNDQALAAYDAPIFLSKADRNRRNLFLCAVGARVDQRLAGQEPRDAATRAACRDYDLVFRASTMAKVAQSGTTGSWALKGAADRETRAVYKASEEVTS